MVKTLTRTSTWYSGLSEEAQIKVASDLADLCSPVEEVATLRGLLEETDSYTIQIEGTRPVGFTVGELTCPVVGGRRSRVKKQTRRTQRKRRNTKRR
jgi:hypothetical protein